MSFEQFVGQEFVKNKLKFYLQSYEKNRVAPFLLFVGASGLGKTEFAREFASNLKKISRADRKFIEINSSTIKTLNQFLNDVFVPHIQNKDVTVFFDEAHALPKDIVMAFLTIFNTEDVNHKEFTNGDETYLFDFTQQTFIFATTESDKIFSPLRDRLTAINFDSYNSDDLGQIFLSQLKDISFDKDALDLITSTFRGNARNCVSLVKDTKNYSRNKNIKNFTVDNVKELCQILGIFPQGLTQIEWRILNILSSEGRASLQTLAAKTGLSRGALQRHHENYLLYKGFMEIDLQRVITRKGKELILNNK